MLCYFSLSKANKLKDVVATKNRASIIRTCRGGTNYWTVLKTTIKNWTAIKNSIAKLFN